MIQERIVSVRMPKWLRDTMAAREQARQAIRGGGHRGGLPNPPDGARVRLKEKSYVGGPIPRRREGAWAVLCPGPILDMYEPYEGQYAGVIGVNRASCHYECDWAAMLDTKTFGECLKHVGGFQGRPGLLVPEGDGRAILNEYEEARQFDRVLSINRLHDTFEFLKVPWTMNVACQAAWALGANKVDVFGAAWRGTTDVDGFRAVGDRSDLRWKKERIVFEKVQKYLAQRGCWAMRVTADE